jgi:ribosomal protein S18 acetylase RimI-like enzyme
MGRELGRRRPEVGRSRRSPCDHGRVSQTKSLNQRVALEVIERYLDAAPRSATDPEPAGKFTLFRPRGPWPYYARPRLGLTDSISASDVDGLRRRQRELGLPENLEWTVETTPSLLGAAAESGLKVVQYPLMILDPAARTPIRVPDGIAVRLLSREDPDFLRAHAVANVGFGVPGTAIGAEGQRERDERAATTSPAVDEFMRARARDGWSVSAAAFDETGPLAVATHQPVGTTTEVVGVATLPAARRRGLAAAVTSALVDDAYARGVRTVFLSAGSDDVARVYERIGFRRIGFAGSAEPA